MPVEDIINSVETPAYVYDEWAILQAIYKIKNMIKETQCQLLFSLKSFALIDALYLMASSVSGFSCSSLFEAKLSREVLGESGSVHIATPGLRVDEFSAIAELCDYVSFNSLSQWERCKHLLNDTISCGLRINPEISFVKDKRYDPCRKHSKLGISLNTATTIFKNDPNIFKNIKGLHFHTNCESTNFNHLLLTVKHIDSLLSDFLDQLEWINIGGGYLFEEIENPDKLHEAISLLNNKHGLDVFFEPGKGIVGETGYVVSAVIDIVENDGQNIAILDTTINHIPEVFEYQYHADLMQESENGEYAYILAGSSCLPGDLFGQYLFDKPLHIGSRIVFEGMGAYTMVKASMFNGINLPVIYALTKEGEVALKKKFSFDEYKSRCGA